MQIFIFEQIFFKNDENSRMNDGKAVKIIKLKNSASVTKNMA